MASPKSACASPGEWLNGTNISWPPIFNRKSQSKPIYPERDTRVEV
jgi:hypothetical protein